LTIGLCSPYHGFKGVFSFENVLEKENFRMKTTRTAGGFSLIELIIAMALVAIVSAIAVPQLRQYSDNADLKTAAREVSGELFAVRQMAVGENLNAYQLTFNVASNSYALSRTDTGVTLWTKSPASFGSGVRLNTANFGGDGVVGFRKRGTVSNGTVTLLNGRGSRATITVNITGRTYVQFEMQ
jgi:prepilin-type N-terminal cleavage/methylation domain-containing protein